jgi:sterol desaturase/sphingolipid hydroxylase (fatty acid hydroxylase superfamily)
MSPESLADYWSYFGLAVQLGFRTVVASLEQLFPTLLAGGYLGLWIVGFLYLCEWLRPWRAHQRRLRDGVWLDLFYTLANFLLFHQLVGTPVFQTAELAFRRALHGAFGLNLDVAVSLAGLHPWLQYLLLFLLVDLLGYLGHVLLHRSNLLWTFHRVHHSARQLDSLNALRQHWAEKLFYDFFAYVPMTLIGFGVEQTALALIVGRLFCTFTHSNLKVPLGPLKYVFNNPQLHLWHHAREVPHNHNVNYGSALSMWDFLFGTSYLPDDRNDVKLGFEGIEEFPTTLLRQQLHPFDRWLPKPTAWTRNLGRVGAVATAALVLCLALLGSVIPNAAFGPTSAGYREHASAQLEQGDPSAALATIERGSLIDLADLPALQRLLARSRTAGFAAPGVRQMLRTARGDANLRFRAGSAWLAEVEAAADLNARQREALGNALNNAELLNALEPGRARSHYLLGATERVRAREGDDPEALRRATTSFRRALVLDGSFPGAREALEDASAGR